MGLMRRDGQVIFVRGVYPGERWSVRVIDVSKDYARGVGVEPLTMSAERNPPACPDFPACGGCTHLDLDYAAQLRLKTTVLADVLARAGVDWRERVELAPSPQFGWRSRAGVHLARRGKSFLMGFKEAAGHRIVEPRACLQLSQSMNDALSDLRHALEQCVDVTRQLRRVELVESYNGERRIATVIGGRMSLSRRLLDRLQGRLESIDTLGAIAEEPRRLRGVWNGVSHVVSRVRGNSYQTHARSFFQANRFLAEDLVSSVARAVPRDAVVLDLYSGAGLFSIALASQMKRVIGIEINPFAVHDARVNARAAGLANVEFMQGDVSKTVVRVPRGDTETIVVDPPRGGLPRDLVAHLQERRPASIVYVSCDPPSLARDLVRFARAGYELRSVEALDLFPGTFHIESVAWLEL
jgi:23S rRNA (uracil1939-C5)-methyltransferase